MKRIFILLVIAALVSPVFAAEDVLIDFNLLVPDTTVGTNPEHEATIVDFAEVAGASFTFSIHSALPAVRRGAPTGHPFPYPSGNTPIFPSQGKEKVFYPLP